MENIKRIASASGLGSMLGSVLGGGPSASERPRNSDGAGPSAGGREEDEDEEASHEKTATTNLISAGHESFALIFMMLMGIRTSVGRFCAQAPDARELAPTDFEQQWEGDFLGKGSAETPAHGNCDFRFKDYAPLVFRQIRERFGIEAPDYMLSLTSECVLLERTLSLTLTLSLSLILTLTLTLTPTLTLTQTQTLTLALVLAFTLTPTLTLTRYVLVEMFTNSKSGSFFFYSSDFRFILKTCTKREVSLTNTLT